MATHPIRSSSFSSSHSQGSDLGVEGTAGEMEGQAGKGLLFPPIKMEVGS